MAKILGYQDQKLLALPPNVCWVEWRAGVPCPNEWTHVVENLAKPGYMKCCELHKEGFLRLGVGIIKVWTKEEWTPEKEKEILEAIRLDGGLVE